MPDSAQKLLVSRAEDDSLHRACMKHRDVLRPLDLGLAFDFGVKVASSYTLTTCEVVQKRVCLCLVVRPSGFVET